MTAVAIVFLALSILIVWGGALWSALSLRAHPEIADYPPGDPDELDDHREDAAVIEHDT